MANYGKWMAAGVRKTVRAIHREHPIDYIDGHYVYPDGTAAAAMGRELGIPVAISARGTDLNLYSRMPPIVPLIKANLDGCRTLVCVCSALKDEALRLGMPAGKIRVIGNGVDTSLFKRADRAESRRRLGIPQGKTVFLSVGHMTERKGFHLILEAFSRLGLEDKFLAIAGDGPQRGELDSLAAKRDLGGKILFPGAVPNQDLPTWYSAADFFVLASSREGWPNVVCEAQAIGLPVIATKVWGIPEIVTDASLGMLVDERNPDRLLEAMERSLAIAWDRGHIEKVGQARTWDNVSEDLVEVFAR
jgi:glycosyltransferase involved in cell wall biosynthesis